MSKLAARNSRRLDGAARDGQTRQTAQGPSPERTMIEINGVAHIVLTVSAWDRCRPFYEALLSFLGLERVFSTDNSLYYVGGRTAVGVGRCDDAHAAQRFVQGGVGLHHVCFRARSRDDVDGVHRFLLAREAKIVHPPEEGPWAPGYYSLLFEDPSGVRLEINHVPGKGVLEKGASFNPAGDYD
jgi:catechol 2,3-dioxygenase-like lactoylglutathione lyase family enzyme